MTRETAGRRPGPEVETSAVAAARQLRQRSCFWAAAFAFLVVMAVATLPSPLYGLYRTRDHLSALTITVVQSDRQNLWLLWASRQ
jgi:hypothetical protein